MTEGDDRLVDRDGFAGSLGESPRALPDPGGLFATLQRVIDATREVFQVDGPGWRRSRRGSIIVISPKRAAVPSRSSARSN